MIAAALESPKRRAGSFFDKREFEHEGEKYNEAYRLIQNTACKY